MKEVHETEIGWANTDAHELYCHSSSPVFGREPRRIYMASHCRWPAPEVVRPARHANTAEMDALPCSTTNREVANGKRRELRPIG